MSLFPFSTVERNEAEIPVPSATSASETPRERLSCRSRVPSSLPRDSWAVGPAAAAGSIVALVVWVYYTAQIVFLGAEFTQVYARRFGSRIVPGPNAVPAARDRGEHQDEGRDPALARARS